MAQVDSENSIAMPARPAGSIISPGLARQERDREKALRRIAKLRRKASDQIERLIDFLDASDPYAATELEDAHDGREPDVDGEPSLCGVTADCDGWGDTSDREEEEGNDEPSLGWTIDGALGGRRDLEEQCEDEGVAI